MARRVTPPSISLTAFDCPYCGALTTQYWHKLYAIKLDGSRKIPVFLDDDFRDRVNQAKEIESEQTAKLLEYADKIDSGDMFIDRLNDSKYVQFSVENVCVSSCYNCSKIAIWIHKKMIYPHQKIGVMPNADLPDDILKDYEEAREILNLSPRGAAALLRLCVQKLCVHLGGKGKNIDDDIAHLVANRLDPLVQKALDVVRVIGNEAVHPGVIDLKDDHDTAVKLFELINIIAEQMITQPNTVQMLYDMIPETKKKAIEERNNKATKPNS